MFRETQNCTSPYLQSACNNTISALGIYWPAVTWSDLRKPLYSGIAAALYSLLTLGSQSMPGSITSQANLWVQMYGGQNKTFIDMASHTSTVGKTIRFQTQQDSTTIACVSARFPYRHVVHRFRWWFYASTLCLILSQIAIRFNFFPQKIR